MSVVVCGIREAPTYGFSIYIKGYRCHPKKLIQMYGLKDLLIVLLQKIQLENIRLYMTTPNYNWSNLIKDCCCCQYKQQIQWFCCLFSCKKFQLQMQYKTTTLHWNSSSAIMLLLLTAKTTNVNAIYNSSVLYSHLRESSWKI